MFDNYFNFANQETELLEREKERERGKQKAAASLKSVCTTGLARALFLKIKNAQTTYF